MASYKKQIRSEIHRIVRVRLKNQLVESKLTNETKDIFGNRNDKVDYYIPLSIAEVEALEEELYNLFNVCNKHGRV